MFVSTLIAALALGLPQASKVERISVRNVSAGYLAKRIQQTLDTGITLPGMEYVGDGKLAPKKPNPPTGLQMLVDSATNSLIAKGPDDWIQVVADLAKLFDVKPTRVLLIVHYSLPGFGIDCTSRIEVANLEEHRFKETAAGFELIFVPRVNDDGTVTIKADVLFGESKVSTVGRLTEKSGLSAQFDKPKIEFRLLKVGG